MDLCFHPVHCRLPISALCRQVALCVALITSTPQLTVADDVVLEDQIDKLLAIESPGVGYSTWFSGRGFLPYPESEELGAFIIGATERSSSESLRKIVEQGGRAIPVLLQHMNDQRKIALPALVADGAVWMAFPDEYDFNSATQARPPQGVNRELFEDDKPKHPTSHSVTIGDLCFVALGQIVNRDFAATRYQPTLGIIVNSPTSSDRLRAAILADWTGLTVEKHKQMLIEDFRHPDRMDRRCGAYLRLAFYYPDAVEAVVVEVLSQPFFDSTIVEEFCYGTLYKCPEPIERQRLYDEFIQKHGSVFTAGVEAQLFSDLEAIEKGRVEPPLAESSTQLRELLVQLFKWPATVQAKDCPVLQVASRSERIWLI